MNVAIIPARGGSQRILGKNSRKFHGKPIICYSIETAKESGLFDRIIVSTDNPGIAETARLAGAEVQPRPRELADDQTGTQAVATYVLDTITPPGAFACVIYATAPMMTAADLKRGYDALLQNPESLYAVAIRMRPVQYAGTFFWGRWEAFMDEIPLEGEHTIKIVIPANRVMDINTEADWRMAESMYSALHETDPA